MRPTFFGFDVETTGLNPETDEILSLSMQLLAEDLSPIASETIFAIPNTPCSAEAAAVNGYNEELWRQRGAVSQRSLYDRVCLFTSEQRKLIPLGHNVGFDLSMLKALYRRQHSEGVAAADKLFSQTFHYHIIDTVGIAMFFDMVLFKQISGTYKLTDLTQRFGISHEDAHDAASDVSACVSLFRHLFTTLGGDRLNVPAPATFSRMMIKQGDAWVINGGKKKGRTVLDVATEDVTYIDWMLRKIEDLNTEQRSYLISIRDQVKAQSAQSAQNSTNTNTPNTNTPTTNTTGH